MLKTLGEEYSLHDFRIVRGASHTNVIFDVEMPFESKTTLADVENKMTEEFAAEEKKYYFVLSRDAE